MLILFQPYMSHSRQPLIQSLGNATVNTVYVLVTPPPPLHSYPHHHPPTQVVSGHGPIKMPKDRLFQTPSGPWFDLNNSSVGLVSHCFYDVVDKPAIIFH